MNGPLDHFESASGQMNHRKRKLNWATIFCGQGIEHTQIRAIKRRMPIHTYLCIITRMHVTDGSRTNKRLRNIGETGDMHSL